MSILWIYDQPIEPQTGGTERATHLVMNALTERGYVVAGFLVISQDHPRKIQDRNGCRVDDLYLFLKDNNVDVVVNQIGYSKWLLEEFLERGGQRWKNEGGRILTKLHFDPLMFSTTLKDLMRHWRHRSPLQKIRRIGRIVLLPLERFKAASCLHQAYVYLIEQSDYFIILSEKHRQKLREISRTKYPDRIHVIPNPNTFVATFTHDRLKQKKNTVLIVSRLDEPQKRISLALKAWGHVTRLEVLSDWTLKIVGEGEYGDDYRELVKKNRIQNVQFIGHTNPEPFYEEASLYLHSAKREGWGLTITEAMQKGAVPIVMNSSPVFEELIQHDENGILSKDGNVKSLALNLIELMNDRNKRERMAMHAIDTAQKHGIEPIIDKWKNLFIHSKTDLNQTDV